MISGGVYTDTNKRLLEKKRKNINSAKSRRVEENTITNINLGVDSYLIIIEC